MKQLLLRLPIPWVFILTYLLGVGVELAFPLRISAPISPHIALSLGVALFALGALIAGCGWITFYKASTTRVPGQLSIQLVTWGPYRFTRNPMYVGLTLAYLGEAAMLRQLWPVLLLPLVLAYVNRVVIPLEKAKLTEVFGETYQRYCRRVRQWV
jgi:protein-S-isoprenylcysteine O-methyltransferase Ste14